MHESNIKMYHDGGLKSGSIFLLTQTISLYFCQFLSYDPEDGKITEKQFADMLLTYSSFNDKKKQIILKRVKKAFKDNAQVLGIQLKKLSKDKITKNY